MQDECQMNKQVNDLARKVFQEFFKDKELNHESFEVFLHGALYQIGTLFSYIALENRKLCMDIVSKSLTELLNEINSND